MSTPAAALPAPVVAKFVPKVIQQLTFPQWKLRAGSELFVLLTSRMHLGDPLKTPEPVKDGEKPKEPVTLIEAIALDTGEVGQFITGSILKDLFNDKFPNDSYVGKSFWIRVGEQKDAKTGGGRRYNTYTISLIETPESLAEIGAKAAAKVAPKAPEAPAPGAPAEAPLKVASGKK